MPIQSNPFVDCSEMELSHETWAMLKKILRWYTEIEAFQRNCWLIFYSFLLCKLIKLRQELAFYSFYWNLFCAQLIRHTGIFPSSFPPLPLFLSIEMLNFVLFYLNAALAIASSFQYMHNWMHIPNRIEEEKNVKQKEKKKCLNLEYIWCYECTQMTQFLDTA